jgi:MFS family permease
MTDLLTAGRIGLLVIVAVLTGACSLLSYAHHRTFTVVSLASFLFVYNAVLLFGFIAYLLGVGLAIASFALWILLREWPLWKRTILFCAVGVALFLLHLYAVGIFGLCAGAYELGCFVQSRRRDQSYRWSHFLPLLVCGVAALGLLAASPTGEKYAQVTWPHYLAPWHYLTRIAMLSDTLPSPDRVSEVEQQA